MHHKNGLYVFATKKIDWIAASVPNCNELNFLLTFAANFKNRQLYTQILHTDDNYGIGIQISFIFIAEQIYI